MKKIILNYGKYALVDDDVYESVVALGKWWCAFRDNNTYARNKNNIYMHRFILKVEGSQNYVDHKNRNGLDNRRENLRVTNVYNNFLNHRGNPNKKGRSSKFKGVVKAKDCVRWRVYIGLNNKTIYLGSFKKETDAALKYNEKAKELFGEYAYLNEI